CAGAVDSQSVFAVTGLLFQNGHEGGWVIYARIKDRLMCLSLVFGIGINIFRSNYDHLQNDLRSRTLYLVFARGRAFKKYFACKGKKNHHGGSPETCFGTRSWHGEER